MPNTAAQAAGPESARWLVDLMHRRAEYLSDRRQASTAAFSAVSVGVVAADCALLATLNSSGLSALVFMTIGIAAFLVTGLWYRSLSWYRRACDYWFEKIRDMEASHALGSPFTEEYCDLYQGRVSPISLDSALAGAFVVLFAIQALISGCVALTRV